MGRGFLTGIFVLIGLAFLAGCADHSARRSIVGDWEIPSDAELASESMSLWFRQMPRDSEIMPTLDYILTPDGWLTIERGRDRSVCCFGGVDHHFHDGQDRVKLSYRDAQQIRRMLALMRPRTMSAEFPFSLPPGCTFVNDARARGGAMFRKGKVGGALVLQPECLGPGPDHVDRLIRAVLDRLPKVRNGAMDRMLANSALAQRGP